MQPVMATNLDSEPEVRVALRVLATIYEQIRCRARQKRLSVNQAIVRAMERFSGSTNAGLKQEIRDLLELCKVLGNDVTPQLKRALTERISVVYEVNLPVTGCSSLRIRTISQNSDSEGGGGNSHV